MLYLLIVNFLFALTYPMIEFLTKLSSIETLLFLRMFISGSIILIYKLIKNYKNLAIKEKKDYFNIFFISFFYIFLTFLIETYAIKKITGIEVSLIYLLSPIISVGIGALFFNEKIDLKRSLILVFSIFILFLSQYKNNIELNILNINFIYYVLLIFSIIISIFSWHKTKELLKKYDILTVNGYAFLTSSFLFLIIGKKYDNNFLIINEKGLYYCILFLLILIGNIFSYNIYEKLLKKYSMNTIVLSWFLSPFFLFVINLIFFGIYPDFKNIFLFIIFFILLNIFYYLDNEKII